VDAALVWKVTSEDPFAGIPEPSQLGKLEGDLNLYYDDVYSLSTADRNRLRTPRRKSRAGRSIRVITNSEGGSFDAAIGYKVLANSHGFIATINAPTRSVQQCHREIEGSADAGDYWYSVANSLKKLEPAEEVGRIAASGRCGVSARAKSNCKSSHRLRTHGRGSAGGTHLRALNGDSIYRGASFLTGKLNEKIAGDNINVVDDGTMLGGFGTSPFDSEGVPSRKTVVVENGVLKSYLLNTYTAKKLSLHTTGNASRGLAGTRASAPAISS